MVLSFRLMCVRDGVIAVELRNTAVHEPERLRPRQAMLLLQALQEAALSWGQRACEIEAIEEFPKHVLGASAASAGAADRAEFSAEAAGRVQGVEDHRCPVTSARRVEAGPIPTGGHRSGKSCRRDEQHRRADERNLIHDISTQVRDPGRRAGANASAPAAQRTAPGTTSSVPSRRTSQETWRRSAPSASLDPISLRRRATA